MTYRHLHLTSPLMHGSDVRRLQTALKINASTASTVPSPREAVHYRKLILGFPSKNLDGAGPFFQEVLYGKRKLGPRSRLAPSTRAENRQRARSSPTCATPAAGTRPPTGWSPARAAPRSRPATAGAPTATRLAGPLAGRQRPRPLRQPRRGGLAVVRRRGAGRPTSTAPASRCPARSAAPTGSTATAKANTHGLRAISLSEVDKGDLLLLFGIGVHVGMARARHHGGAVLTIEGNTSFGVSGSQSNGGDDRQARAQRERRHSRRPRRQLTPSHDGRDTRQLACPRDRRRGRRRPVR
jgi:hypothetical protein